MRKILEQLKAEAGVRFDPFALRHAVILRTVQQGFAHDEVSALLGNPSHGVIQLYADESCSSNSPTQSRSFQ